MAAFETTGKIDKPNGEPLVKDDKWSDAGSTTLTQQMDNTSLDAANIKIDKQKILEQIANQPHKQIESPPSSSDEDDGQNDTVVGPDTNLAKSIQEQAKALAAISGNQHKKMESPPTIDSDSD